MVCRHCATQRFLSVIASEQSKRGNPKSKNNAKFMACHARLTPYSQRRIPSKFPKQAKPNNQTPKHPKNSPKFQWLATPILSAFR